MAVPLYVHASIVQIYNGPVVRLGGLTPARPTSDMFVVDGLVFVMFVYSAAAAAAESAWPSLLFFTILHYCTLT